MNLRTKLASGAAFLTAGQLASQASVFLRNVVLVRTLTKSDYGIAATFGIALTLVEMGGNLSLERLLVQAEDGNEPRFQGAAHLMKFLQGASVALLLFFLAPTFAQLFSVPDALWAYRVLPIASLINGLSHFDPSRYHREYSFRPMVLCRAGSQFTSLVLVCALAPFIQDYTLFLWGLISQPIALSIYTHMAAERPYRFAFERSYIQRLWQFGWPITLNGLLMYVTLQGDRFLIGSAETLQQALGEWGQRLLEHVRVYDKEDLAVYSIGMSLCFMPAQLLDRTLGEMVFPLLSRAKVDRDRFNRQYRRAAELFAVWGNMVSVGFILAGTQVVVLIYGEAYRPVESLIGLMGLIQTIRMCRMSTTAAALAMADSKIPLYSNIGRATGVLGAGVAVLCGAHLSWIAVAGVAAEILAAALLSILARARHDIPFKALFPSVAFTTWATAAAFGLDYATLGWNDWARMGLAAVAVPAVPVAAWLLFPDLKAQIQEVLAERAARKAGLQPPELD